MTLAQRLLVAIGVLTIATTLALAAGVRAAWSDAEEERFQAEFRSAVLRLEGELDEEGRELPELLAPLCEHDQLVDGALVDLHAGQLDSGRRLALSLEIGEEMKALRLDELTLLTGKGEVLGAGHASGLVGSHSDALLAEIRAAPREARVRTAPPPVAVVAHCARSRADVTIGLVGARHLESLLRAVSAGEGLTMALTEPRDVSGLMVLSVELKGLSGTRIVATRSRVPLLAALGRLDRAVLLRGGAVFAAALVVAWLLSRGLARPIVRLSEEARRVVTGEPLPIQRGGVRELDELASAFNQTIADLVALRKRLAATERIAARREIARRVAHEIKNPLAPIRAAIETLRRLRARNDPAFDEYFDEATRTVLAEVLRITAIVQEFTRFERLPPPNPEPMDVEAVVRDVVKLHALDGPPIELTVTPVPTLVADRDQIVQVLTNLLQNAMDAVAGAPSPLIVVELGLLDSARVRLVVRDNGPGVAPEMRERLFEPYATTKPAGTGIGLAIVERIIIEHGGEIAYRDAAQTQSGGRGRGGAEFTVLLPVLGPTLLPEGSPPSSRQTSAE